MIIDKKKELLKLKYQNEILSNLFDFLEKNGNSNDKILHSKVEVDSENEELKEGRAIKFSSKENKWVVQVDNHKGINYVLRDKIKIKYPGSSGLIDKLIWENEEKQKEIDKILKDSDLPCEVKGRDIVNIKIVQVYSLFNDHYPLIDFEVLGIQPVLRTKIPEKYAILDSYLQLKIKDGDIIDIHHVSKEKYLEQEKGVN